MGSLLHAGLCVFLLMVFLNNVTGQASNAGGKGFSDRMPPLPPLAFANSGQQFPRQPNTPLGSSETLEDLGLGRLEPEVEKPPLDQSVTARTHTLTDIISGRNTVGLQEHHFKEIHEDPITSPALKKSSTLSVYETPDWAKEPDQWSYLASEWKVLVLAETSLPPLSVESHSTTALATASNNTVTLRRSLSGVTNATITYNYFMEKNSTTLAPELKIYLEVDGTPKQPMEDVSLGIWIERSTSFVVNSSSSQTYIVFEARSKSDENCVILTNIDLNEVTADTDKLNFPLSTEKYSPPSMSEEKLTHNASTADKKELSGSSETNMSTEQPPVSETTTYNLEKETHISIDGKNLDNSSPPEVTSDIYSSTTSDYGEHEAEEKETTAIPVTDTDILALTSNSKQANTSLLVNNATTSTTTTETSEPINVTSNLSIALNDSSVDQQNTTTVTGNNTRPTSTSEVLKTSTALTDVAYDTSTTSTPTSEVTQSSTALSNTTYDANVTSTPTSDVVQSSTALSNTTYDANATSTPTSEVTQPSTSSTTSEVTESSTAPDTKTASTPTPTSTSPQSSTTTESTVQGSTTGYFLVSTTESPYPGRNSTEVGAPGSVTAMPVPASVIKWEVLQVILIVCFLGLIVLGIIYWRKKRQRDDEVPMFTRQSTDFSNPTFCMDDISNFVSRARHTNPYRPLD